MHADLAVRVTPRASRNKIEAPSQGPLRVWVTASPTDGQANAAVCELLARTLGLAKSRVSVIKGDSSRDKTIRVEGMTIEDCRSKLPQ